MLCCVVCICLVTRRRAKKRRASATLQAGAVVGGKGFAAGSQARPAKPPKPQAPRTANEGYQMAIKEHKDLKANQA